MIHDHSRSQTLPILIIAFIEINALTTQYVRGSDK